MHLIAPLVSGVTGAALGKAELYRRGTSMRATWYASFEGDGANSSGTDIQLDSYGGAIVYVNELVYVVVKDTAGTPVRSFVAGDSAAAVEVLSDSFTGTDYSTAQTGVNKPITVKAVLDSWDNSAGADDWNVLVGGSAVTIQNALASTALFVNVKAPQFGATGDGATDDTSAINAAITYANSTGLATVWFPPGTYLISAALSVPIGVNLLGSQSEQVQRSQIKRSTSSFKAVDITGATSGTNRISYLAFTDAAAGTDEALFDAPAGGKVTLDHVIVSGLTGDSPIWADDPPTLEMFHCTFYCPGGAGRIAKRTAPSIADITVMYDCTVHWTGSTAFTEKGLIGNMRIVACDFNVATTAGTALPSPLLQPYSPSTIVGCTFRSDHTDTCRAITLDGSAGAAVDNGIVEAGNQFEDSFVVHGANTAKGLAQSRSGRKRTYTVATGASVSVGADAGLVEVTTTGGAGAVTIDITVAGSASLAGAINNSWLWLIVRNTTANAHTIDFNANTSPADTGVALAANAIVRVLYHYATIGGSNRWWRMTGFTSAVL